MKSNLDRTLRVMSAEEQLSVIISVSEEIFHDFKNKMANISGIAQITATKVESREVRDNLDLIKEATFECRDQIERFYRFVQGHNVDINKEEVLSNVILCSLDMISHRIKKFNDEVSKIALNLNISSMGRVYCNEYKLRQAIINILLNAIDAMEEKGGILEVNLWEKEGMVVVEIIDTGIGIAEGKLEKIFELNYTTKGANGTGLGLVVSKSIFEELGGRLEVCSELGKGTNFTIYLPMK